MRDRDDNRNWHGPAIGAILALALVACGPPILRLRGLTLGEACSVRQHGRHFILTFRIESARHLDRVEMFVKTLEMDHERVQTVSGPVTVNSLEPGTPQPWDIEIAGPEPMRGRSYHLTAGANFDGKQVDDITASCEISDVAN